MRLESAMGIGSPQLSFSSLWWFFAKLEGIRDTFDIKNHSYTSKSPFEDVVLSLQLSWEDVSFSSGLSLVDRADVDALVFLITNHYCTAENNRDYTELLLRFTLFKSVVRIPPCTFHLQSKYECSITLLRGIDLPIHLLLNLSLDVKLVEFK